MTTQAPPPPAPPRKAPPAPRQQSFYVRLLKSKRVRIFFLFSILVHGVLALMLSSNKKLHDWMFGSGDTKATPVEVNAREIRRAMDTLLTLYKQRFTDSLNEMVDIRAKLDAIQQSKLERMLAEDKDRKEKIAAGVWPTADNPNKNAVYKPRIDLAPPRFSLAPLPDTQNMDVVALYRLHPGMEQEVGRIFERFHALELAASLEDPIPLTQSIKNTHLSLPKRRDIDPAKLNLEIDTALDGRFDAFKREITEAYLETQDMLNTARRWLEMAESKDSGFSLAGSFGAQYNVVPAQQRYFGHYLNPRVLKRVTTERLIDPKVALGNRIGPGEVTAGAEWMSIDRWYCIGPFAHPGAKRRMADLERKYPPESGIDLDATYEGKDGRKLKWKYRHMGDDFIEGGIRFEPFTADNEAYAIWYFYTEVWSDTDRKVLTSFASDDYGVCWVNGRRVYQSPPDTQPWVPFTRYGFSAVPLRKGFNRVLFKLENATGTTGFSMIMMTYEDNDLIKALEKRRDETDQ